ncbi:MAG: tyrosine-type recombinase/integrase [Lachnospiraceae bacterium]|nr:tyrosine-type recombinase/integrase [Lachnospiraceae bacterium]
MRQLTKKFLEEFEVYLMEEEKSRATIRKYICDLKKFFDFAGEKDVSKTLAMEYKEYLLKHKNYEISSVNSFLTALNCFLDFVGWSDAKVKTCKVQKAGFAAEEKYLTKAEYKRLVQAARRKGNTRLALIFNTICSTGIRISELGYITVESVRKGKAVIHNKGKVRTILIPKELQRDLKLYIEQKKIENGAIFCTGSGKCMDRSNIWREMKALYKEADVDAEKIFPHNLRHLFAQCFYSLKKDIAKLADVLGHSSIETTRIYIRTTCEEHRKQLEMLGLVV